MVAPRPAARASILAIAAALATPLLARASSPAGGAAPVPAISTRGLLSLKDIGGESGIISVSPDGRLVAFQIQWADFAADTYRADWYVSGISPDATPVRVGSGGDVILAPAPFGRLNGARADIRAQWSPDGQWIAYLRRDGDEVQVWRSRADGRGEEQVTRNEANVLAFAWRPDSRAIYFQVGRNRQAMAREDRAEGERGYLLDGRFMPEYSTKPLWFACGRNVWEVPLARSQRCTPRTWIVEFGSPARAASAAEDRAYRRLTTAERPAPVEAGRLIRGVAWNGSHTRAAWLDNVSSGDEGLAAPVTLFVDGHPCPAAPCTGRLEALWWDKTGVIFLRHEGWAYSVPAIYSWNPGSEAVRLLYREDSALRSCAKAAGERLVCLQETPTTPRRIVSIRLQDGRVDTVFDPNPGFARYRLGRVEKLEVSDGLGNRAFGHLVYPPDFRAGGRYPLVIVQYRSTGFLRGGVGDEYPIFPLAAAGFLVYSSDNPVDERLAARYDPSHWQGLAALTGKQVGAGGYRMRSALAALDAVIDRLDRRRILDGSRIGITGLSAGAEALYFALTHSTRFAAAATSGLAVPQSAFLEVNGTLRAITEAEWGAHSLEEAVRNASDVESLASHVDRMNTPLLIQVSDHELISVVPDYVALLAAGKPVEAYVFPDEFHVKSHPLHKLAVGDRAIDWFRFWLKGEEDPAPQKAEQYARWREMRRHAPPLSAVAEGKSGPSSCSRGDSGCPACTAAPGSRPDLRCDAREERR